MNDTRISLASTICVFASGAIVTSQGWTILAIGALPILAVALAWVLLPGRHRIASAQPYLR
ncbi:hypothetical protein [Celeribacter baekdonensis]|uniref:Uncharacterized protein n=1 Tax=Celeribacter baekdonensis B30 TaxID=1208323 RepID=K2IMI2_9RHOB|nr:hypothetical protein B30_11545 [Celeribacter baekdonensis B30]KAB6718050.1 hypothetical protein C8029_00630 [Roseobacter sp. TSBP12]